MEVERQRVAEQRLAALTDASIGVGLKLGMKYIDPKGEPRKPSDPYHSLEGFLAHEQFLREIAYPWIIETPEQREARLDREQDAAFDRLFKVMQPQQA